MAVQKAELAWNVKNQVPGYLQQGPLFWPILGPPPPCDVTFSVFTKMILFCSKIGNCTSKTVLIKLKILKKCHVTHRRTPSILVVLIGDTFLYPPPQECHVLFE
jgi:hypothetical protein